MDDNRHKKTKSDSPVRTTPTVLWLVMVVVTVVLWKDIWQAAWYWKVGVVFAHLVLLSCGFRPGADVRAGIDAKHRFVRALISQKKYTEALKVAESALAASPDHAPMLYAKGECLSNLGRMQQAEQAYLKVLELDPSHAFAANNLATLYMNKGRYLKAAEYYRQAQEAGASGDWFDRNLHRIWNNLAIKGTELVNAGEELKAVEYFRLAKDFGAEGLVFNNNLQVLKNDLMKKGGEVEHANQELALKYAEAIISLEPQWAIAYGWRGTLLYNLARYSEALQDLNRCVELDPSQNSDKARDLIKDVKRALAESQKMVVPAKTDTASERRSMVEQYLWQVGKYAFDRFQVKNIIRGGMGDIYFCWDRTGQTPLVLKAIAMDKLVDSRKTTGKNVPFRELFKREAERWFSLGRHRNIVRLYTVEDFEHRHLVLFMEYIAGQPGIGPTLRDHLDHHLKRRTRLPAKEVIQIGVNICDAMEFAYEKSRLVHRDLKPENIFLTDEGVAKVGDFGLVAKEGDSTDILAGTGPYVAPELPISSSDLPYLPSTTMDIYAVGAILYEMLTGRIPIPRDKTWKKDPPLEQWIWRHMRIEPLPLTEANAEVSSDLAKIVMKCLSKQPEARFLRFSELREALVTCPGAEQLGLDFGAVEVEDSAKNAARDLYNEAITLDNLKRYEGSLEIYRQLVKSEPYKSEISVAWCNMGKVLATLHRYSKSLECFQRAIDINPVDTHALFGRANALASLQKYKEALAGLQALLAVDPTYRDAYVCKGSVLLHSGQVDEAEAAYLKALNMHQNKQHPFALNGLGLCSKKKHLFRQALDYFDKAIAAKEDYDEAYIHRCEVLCHLGRLKEGIEAGRKAVELDPSEPAWMISLAMAYGNAGLFSDAASWFKKVIDLEPKNCFAWLGLATSYAELERPDDAIQCARHAARLGYPDAQQLVAELERSGRGKRYSPDIIETVNKILKEADQAIKQQRWQKAVELYEKALAKYPDNSLAWTNLGSALMRLRRIEKAKEALEKAIKIDPDNADANANLGVLLARDLNRPTEGKKYLVKALKINPNHPSSLYLKSLRATMKGEDKMMIFRRPKKGQAPHSKDSRLPFEKQMEADSLEAQGKYREALAIYEDFLKAHPDSIQVLNNAATVYNRMRNPSKALQLLEKVVRLDPKYVKAWNNLGTAKLMLGDVAGAKKAYQKTLEIDPQNIIARKALLQAQTIEKQVKSANRVGGAVSSGGTVYSTRNAVLVCAKCGQKYTEFGRMSIHNRAIGGALCRNCSKFYCEPCVSGFIHSGAKIRPMVCECGKSKVRLGDDGCVAMDNFEELVVFRAR